MILCRLSSRHVFLEVIVCEYQDPFLSCSMALHCVPSNENRNSKPFNKYIILKIMPILYVIILLHAIVLYEFWETGELKNKISLTNMA